ncbi:MAG: translation initiation factor IF-2 subunit gamma [Candidatus Aenigmarchaeota archaeon]|nr:translation initiation factor IF-2 subunit gamma [Candidatus Aenigmarchaeota archaeon]
MSKVDPKLIPEVNIGMVGHVDHGKSTITEMLTGKWPAQHSEELKRGITIRLGYADATFYRCPKCGTYSTSKKCPKCFSDTEIQRTVSFVDAPGHESLMATVLTGASLLDGALLVIAADEKCPMPQTKEHLKALEVVGIDKIVIVQNKIDLVTPERAKENYEEIKEFVKGTIAENAPIIPISAQQRVNAEYLIEAIETTIPTPERDPSKHPIMLIARSFDINKPGYPPKKLVGGILGGSLIQGRLKVCDEIEIRPGIKVGNDWKSLTTEVVSLQKAGITLEDAGPGGLLGVMTKLDPALTKSDGLAGNVVGHPDKLPPVWKEIELEVHLLERIVGTKEEQEVKPIQKNEVLMINVWTSRSVGIVEEVKGDYTRLKLKLPVCAEVGSRVVLSRQIAGRWRLFGWGILK